MRDVIAISPSPFQRVTRRRKHTRSALRGNSALQFRLDVTKLNLMLSSECRGFRIIFFILRSGGQQFLSWPSGARQGRVPLIDCPCRKFLRGEVAEARMWTFPIVLDAPCFDLAARIVERNENVLVEAFLAQPLIEALDVRVLDRLARFDELQPHAMIIGPLVEHPAAQFGTSSGRPRDNNLLWATSIPGPTFLIYPVTGLFGPVVLHNVLWLLCPAAAAFSASLLCQYVCRSFWHSVVISLVFHNTSCLI